MNARLIFADDIFILSQEDAPLFVTIAHVFEDCVKDAQIEREIRIPCEICTNASIFSQLLDEYHILASAEQIDLNRNVDQLEIYLEGIYSYTKDIKELFEALHIECSDLDSSLFLYPQKNPHICEAMERITFHEWNTSPLIQITHPICMVGNIDSIKFLLTRECILDDRKYVHDNLCDWIAEGGCLEMLQWARANDYPWDGWTCACAA